MNLFLDRSGIHDTQEVDTLSKQLGRERECQLNRWIEEDRLAGDNLCVRAFRLWRSSIIARLSDQSGGPLKLPRDLKLPHCLMSVRGLASQKVRLTKDGAVKMLVFSRHSGYVEGMELVPAVD